MKRLWKETGEVWQPPTGTTGRPRVIGEAHRERLRDYLDRNPDALMRDIADFLNDECGVDVTVSTVWRTMVRLGWKETRPRAKDRDSLGQWKPTLPRDENGKPMYGPAKDRGKQKTPRKKKPTPQEALLNRVQIFVQDYMSQPRFDASHDYSHVLRVVNLARHILRVELAENPHVRYEQMLVELAALMHDVNDHKYVPPVNGVPTAVQQKPPLPESSSAIGPSSAPNAEAHPMFDGPASYIPHGRIVADSSLRQPSQGIAGPSNQASHEQSQPQSATPHLDPSLTSTPLPNSNTFATPSSQYQPFPNTPQTQPLQPPQTPATQPQFKTPNNKALPQQRTIEEHLLRLRAPAPLAAAVSTICSAISYSTETRDPEHIATVLATHPELAIVQDADRLDALGAVGVGRAFAFGGARGRGMEDTIEHVDEKLVRLEGLMKTAEGRRMARVRAERLHAFRSWWEEERDVGLGAESMEGVDDSMMSGGLNGGDSEMTESPWQGGPTPGPHERINGSFQPAMSGTPSLGQNVIGQHGMERANEAERQLMMEAGML